MLGGASGYGGVCVLKTLELFFPNLMALTLRYIWFSFSFLLPEFLIIR